MGQKLGKFGLVLPAEPFSNLSRRSISQVWQNFNDIADGFGISKDEMQEICVSLKDELNVSRLAILEKAGSFFATLDTDNNGLIDALEMISCIAAISGMTLQEIVEFVLSSYDFDGTLGLNTDEVTLALKSVASGLSKVTNVQAPRDNHIEHLVTALFDELPPTEISQETGSVRISVLVEHLAKHPEISCWYASFGEPPQLGLHKQDALSSEVDYEEEGIVENTSKGHNDAVEWVLQNEQKAYEPKNSNEESSADGIAWFNSSAGLTPSDYAFSVMPRNPPDVSLELDWVFGYQGEKSKNNLRYSRSGQIVYHSGQYALSYDFDAHKQHIFTGHAEEILCLTLHPDGLFAATGDKGPNPRLVVWNTINHNILFSDRGFHRCGVNHVAFSKDGKLLASVGMDLEHCVAVHRWETNELLFTSFSDRGKCLGLTFLNNGAVAVCGDSYLYFWNKSSEGYVKRRGNFSRHSPVQALTCIAPIGHEDSIASGTSSGQMFLWTDRNCVRTAKGHKGSVISIYSCTHGVLSGGKDHRVRLWTHRLEPGATFDMSSFGHNPSIRSVCMSPDGTSILVGTRACEVYEISAVDGSDLRGGLITSTHNTGKLRDIAVHPKRHEFATVGDDGRLRIWDMNTKTLLKVATFDAEVRCVCYGPMGDILVVGLGGDPSLPKSGAYAVINEEDLTLVHESKDSTQPISVVSFSGEGETLAVGSEDGSVYLYAVQDEYELIGRCVRHTAAVNHIDFSIDGEWLRTNSVNGELCFFNADDASFQSNSAAMRDTKWFSNTCVYSWHSRGIHRTPFDGEAVTALVAPGQLAEATYMIAGTNYGYTKILAMPCVPQDSDYFRSPAHSGAISGVKFSYNSQRFITTGRDDRTVVQWSVKLPPVPEKSAEEEAEDEAAEAAAGDTDNASEAKEKEKEAMEQAKAEVKVSEDQASESEDFALEARDGADLINDFYVPHATAVSGVINGTESDPVSMHPNMDQWLESMVPPANPPPRQTQVPGVSMRLDYAYGYRCQDMRNNVRYSADDNEIVFVCATIGVVMNKTTRAQNFYQGHTESITSFAASPDGTLVATGQMGLNPTVCIWKTGTRSTLKVLPDLLKNAVGALAFSNDNKKIATVSLDTDHTVSIYDWRLGLLVGRVHAGARRVLNVCFSPDDSELLGVGMKTITMWNTSTRALVATRPNLGNHGCTLQAFLCGVYFGGKTIACTADGNLYCFMNHIVSASIKAHKSGVHAVDVSPDRASLATGGKDGIIRLWTTDLDCVKEIRVDSIFPAISTRVRTINFNRTDPSILLVGTQGAEIFEVSTRDGSLINGKPILQSHGCRELWGISTHPTKAEFITSGDDATIRFWDIKSFTMTRTIRIDCPSRAVTYSPDGKYICVGFGNGKRGKGKKKHSKDGAFIVLTTADFKMAHEGKDSSEPIRAIKFSPDSKILAIASEDSRIYLYNVKDQFSRRCTISYHKAPVTSVDFSKDSSYVMTVDSSKRMFFCETTSGSVISAGSSLREEKWSTWSSPIGWHVRGMWQMLPLGVEPISAQRSCNGLLLACGTNAGRLFISHFPCPEKSGFISDAAHSGPISQVSWAAGDGTVLSTGSRDHAILQWKCVYDDSRESGDEGGMSCDDSEEERDAGHEFTESSIVRKLAAPSAQSTAWMASVTPPSVIKDDDLSRPQISVEPAFIHGIHLSDCRQSLRYNQDGNLVMFATSFGIVYDRRSHSQMFYSKHKSSIISLDVDSSGLIAATGELSNTPELHFWDARTATQLSVVGDVHRRGITGIAFSKSSEFCVTLGQDILNSVTVMTSPSKSWRDVFIISSVSVCPAKMLWVSYVESNPYPIVVGGHHCMYFFRSVGKGMERLKGVFGRQQKIQTILCGTVGGELLLDGDTERTIVTGTVTGHLYTWFKNRIHSRVTAHDAPIFAVTNIARGYASGAKDGLVKLWGEGMEPQYTYNVQSFSPQPYHLSIHSLKANSSHSKLVVGMRGGEIYEVSLSTQTHQLLLEGHSRKELHGIELNPANEDEFATVGDDGVLKVWSISRNFCIRKLALECACRAISWSPNGNELVVGVGGDPSMAVKDGAFMVLRNNPLEIFFEDRKAKLTITDIKYSPQGNIVAIASRDGKIYLHETGKYTLLRTMELAEKEHGITRFDFNVSGTYIRMSTTNDDLLSYAVNDGLIVASPAIVRDETWKTTQNPYGWMTKG